eukprot:Gb_19344 [translate_table: standard]
MVWLFLAFSTFGYAPIYFKTFNVAEVFSTLDCVIQHQRQLENFLDPMTSCKNQGRNSRSRKGRNYNVLFLVDIDLTVTSPFFFFSYCLLRLFISLINTLTQTQTIGGEEEVVGQRREQGRAMVAWGGGKGGGGPWRLLATGKGDALDPIGLGRASVEGIEEEMATRFPGSPCGSILLLYSRFIDDFTASGRCSIGLGYVGEDNTSTSVALGRCNV